MRKIKLIFCLLLIVFLAKAQQKKDTLFLMNGKIYTSKVLDTLLGGVTIKDVKDTTKNFTVDNEDLFAVHYSSGEMYYYYSQDTATGNEFTRDEMGYFMQGERDAKKGFKGRGSLFGDMALGFVGGLRGCFPG